MTITAEEYLRQNRKTVILPSGAVFEIKKITGRDYLKSNIEFPLYNAVDTSENVDKATSLWASLTVEQKTKYIKLNEWTITSAVISPEITETRQEGKLCISDISDEDFNFILAEINNFSMQGRQEIKPFRTESKASDIGSDSKEICEIAVGVTEIIA